MGGRGSGIAACLVPFPPTQQHKLSRRRGQMASPAAVARLRELAPAPEAELSAASVAALAECCTGLLRPGGADAEAARAVGGGDAMQRHADGLTPLVVGR